MKTITVALEVRSDLDEVDIRRLIEDALEDHKLLSDDHIETVLLDVESE